ncbi:phytanoyl-CoA dioxygenase family protein, partial [bacterium]|nr:phytanoyl-CoA dioxygenase family protein [bacterium]
MTATAASLQKTFTHNGYVVVPGVLSRAEVAAAKAEVRRALEEAGRGRDELGIDTRRDGVYVGLAIRSELFRRLHADPRIVDPLAECVGPNLEFWSDKIVFKSAAVDYGSPWHQDWQCLSIYQRHFFSCVFPSKHAVFT